jgi:hypothetical protein
MQYYLWYKIPHTFPGIIIRTLGAHVCSRY